MKTYKEDLGKVSITINGEHDITKSYSRLCVVYDNETKGSYISKKEVPSNIELSNTNYWMPLWIPHLEPIQTLLNATKTQSDINKTNIQSIQNVLNNLTEEQIVDISDSLNALNEWIDEYGNLGLMDLMTAVVNLENRVEVVVPDPLILYPNAVKINLNQAFFTLEEALLSVNCRNIFTNVPLVNNEKSAIFVYKERNANSEDETEGKNIAFNVTVTLEDLPYIGSGATNTECAHILFERATPILDNRYTIESLAAFVLQNKDILNTHNSCIESILQSLTTCSNDIQELQSNTQYYNYCIKKGLKGSFPNDDDYFDISSFVGTISLDYAANIDGGHMASEIIRSVVDCVGACVDAQELINGLNNTYERSRARDLIARLKLHVEYYENNKSFYKYVYFKSVEPLGIDPNLPLISRKISDNPKLLKNIKWKLVTGGPETIYDKLSNLEVKINQLKSFSGYNIVTEDSYFDITNYFIQANDTIPIYPGNTSIDLEASHYLNAFFSQIDAFEFIEEVEKFYNNSLLKDGVIRLKIKINKNNIDRYIYFEEKECKNYAVNGLFPDEIYRNPYVVPSMNWVGSIYLTNFIDLNTNLQVLNRETSRYKYEYGERTITEDFVDLSGYLPTNFVSDKEYLSAFEIWTYINERGAFNAARNAIINYYTHLDRLPLLTFRVRYKYTGNLYKTLYFKSNYHLLNNFSQVNDFLVRENDIECIEFINQDESSKTLVQLVKKNKYDIKAINNELQQLNEFLYGEAINSPDSEDRGYLQNTAMDIDYLQKKLAVYEHYLGVIPMEDETAKTLTFDYEDVVECIGTNMDDITPKNIIDYCNQKGITFKDFKETNIEKIVIKFSEEDSIICYPKFVAQTQNTSTLYGNEIIFNSNLSDEDNNIIVSLIWIYNIINKQLVASNLKIIMPQL